MGEVTSPLGLALGLQTLIVGLGETAGGKLKVYLGARYRGTYVVADDSVRAEIEREWANTSQHIVVDHPPPEALFSDEDDAMHLGRS